MSIEAVARLAKVGKTTIYRWWRSRAHVALDACYESTVEILRFPETGSVEGDFRAQVHLLGNFLRSRDGLAFINIILASRHDPALRSELGESWLKPRQAWGYEKMRQLPVADVAVALNSLYGPLYAPILFALPPLDARQIDVHLDMFFAGLQASK